MSTAADQAVAPPPLDAEASALLQAFARACRAATRAIGLYPGEHPTVTATMTHLVTAATRATSRGELALAVMAETFAIDGRRPSKPDVAVAELAALLHAHQVGVLTIQPHATPDEWRRFLGLLALPPDQLRRRGGLAHIWSSEGQAAVQVRQIDYHLLLRERIRGERATWDAVVSQCLQGEAAACDEAVTNLVMELLDRPEDCGHLLTEIQDRVQGAPGRTAVVVSGVLRAILEFVQRTNPDQLDPLLIAVADLAPNLPTDALAAFGARGASATPAAQGLAARLARHLSDDTLARHAATAADNIGSSDTFDRLVTGFLPDVDRRSAVLAMARHMLEETAGGHVPAEVQARITRLLAGHDERPFVSDPYAGELRRAAARAVTLEEAHTDEDDVVSAWRESVSDDRIRMLDAQLLMDLMHLHRDVEGWKESAGLVAARITALMTAGDFSPAAFLVESLRLQHEDHPSPEIRTAAGQAVESLLRGDLIRHIAIHLDTAQASTVTAAKRLCHALGTGVTVHLAEALAHEERTRPRQHLVAILASFGSAGRQSIERLMQSPSAAVRRTAVLLLREFGGDDALPKLEAMLNDREPHVQREATRAVVLLGVQPAFETLVRILAKGDAESRAAVASVLWSLPIEDAAPALCYLVSSAPQGDDMTAIHERALQRLAGAPMPAVATALGTSLGRGSRWAPFRTALLRRRAAESLARLGIPQAQDILHAAAIGGAWGVRRAARQALAQEREPRS